MERDLERPFSGRLDAERAGQASLASGLTILALTLLADSLRRSIASDPARAVDDSRRDLADAAQTGPEQRLRPRGVERQSSGRVGGAGAWRPGRRRQLGELGPRDGVGAGDVQRPGDVELGELEQRARRGRSPAPGERISFVKKVNAGSRAASSCFDGRLAAARSARFGRAAPRDARRRRGARASAFARP